MNDLPPCHRARLPRALHALVEFFRLEAAGGITLIAAAVLAMIAANSPLAATPTRHSATSP